MGVELKDIAIELRDSQKKVQLIYAFNGTGKTRLSKEFKELIAPKEDYDEGEALTKVIYYNAFTEDLFYWDNDLKKDNEIKLKIHPNTFTKWVLQEQGQDQNIITNFQNFSGSKITPKLSADFSEVNFTLEEESYIKISKGEESSFIWSVFYTLIEQVVEVLNEAEEENRETDKFNKLEYIFIDDPVSSLDENHLIELAVDLATLIRSSQPGVKFIVSTHNPLFYNVLYNELRIKSKKENNSTYMLSRLEDGTFELNEKLGDSNKSFSYHLYLKQTIEQAIERNEIEKYHFTLLRNLYEKTSNFLGYPKWSELLPDDKQAYLNRIVQFTSHSTLSNEVVAEPTETEKKIVKFLFNNLIDNYNFWK